MVADEVDSSHMLATVPYMCHQDSKGYLLLIGRILVVVELYIAYLVNAYLFLQIESSSMEIGELSMTVEKVIMKLLWLFI